MTPLCKIEVTHPRVLGPGRCAVAVLSMSKQEFSRLDVLLRVQSGHLRAVARWGFLGIGRSTPMARRSGGSATADWREPANSDRLTIHRT